VNVPELDPIDADAPAHDRLAGPEGKRLAHRVAAEELGEQTAQAYADAWHTFETWQPGLPDEGLRERKKRLTRQRISDIATAMFAARGFDNVRVAEVAERAGVSEKTVYNYFPTKESLVFDQADAQFVKLTESVRDRDRDISPTEALLDAINTEMSRFVAALPHLRPGFVRNFSEMVHNTPALRAALGEHRHRLVEELSAILAAEREMEPRDPEPLTVARGLVSLLELSYDMQRRHLSDDVDSAELARRISEDLRRGAQLIDTTGWQR
jgi:AcrR family transcriptional regulator